MTLTALLNELRLREIRIWEEDGQLRVRAPSGALDEDLRRELPRRKDELLALLARARAGGRGLQPIPRAPRGPDLPLSPAQRRLWVLEQLRGDGPAAYNIAAAFVARGPLDVAALQACVAGLIARHETLRTRFVMAGGEPRQVVLPRADLALDFADWSSRPDAERAFEEEARRAARLPFALDQAPLVRVLARKLGAERHGLALALHHMVADGASVSILCRELATLYADHRNGRAPGLPPLALQYADFAPWQGSLLEAEEAAAHRAFWLSRFATPPAPLELPLDFPRPPQMSFGGDEVSLLVPRETAEGLKGLARRAEATLFMVLLAAVDVLLHRWTGQADVTVGTPVAGRPHPDLESQVGCYVNTLALRAWLDRREGFLGLLGRVRELVMAAQDHQLYPFDRLVDDLDLPRDLSRSPLFDVMVAMPDADAARLALEGLEIRPLELARGVSQFDLSVEAAGTPGGLAVVLRYRTDLFRRERIERFGRHLSTLLAEVAASPEKPVGSLAVLPADERSRVVAAFNRTAAPYSREQTLVGLFEEQARRTPEAVAVVAGERRLTYAELDGRANALARRLARERGAGRERRVALLAERSERMAVALFAVLKAGAAYVPVNPEDPAARIAGLLEDCRPDAVLWDGTGSRELEGMAGSWLRLDRLGDDAEPRALPGPRPDDAAYVIYTSGSTGRPKGVLIEHRSVVNRLEWMQRQYGLGPGDAILQKTPFTFDVSVWELFWWSLCGASLHLLEPGGEKDPEAILAAIRAGGVTKLHFVPSMLRVFLQHLAERGDAGALATLTDVFASGEALSGDLVTAFREQVASRCGARLHNLYGPTEATVDVSFFDCAAHREGPVPIGAPIANTQLYVLDAGFEPVGIGVAGEIAIGGVNVGRGYLGRPDRTAERFVPDPFASEPGGRLYRTGDLGRWRDDGTIEYVGRTDHQVKVRGHRIELGEVEAALRAHPGVQDAAVVARDAPGGPELVAYLIAEPGAAPTVQSVKAHLASRLPAAFLPAQLVPLSAWPLTPSGKLDRKALPAPEGRRLETETPQVAPRTGVERQLAEIFSEVLGVERVGVHDDFFDLGGHSLKATRLLARARQRHGLDLTLRDVFARPTVAGLAERAVARDPVKGRPIVPVAPQPHHPLSHAQRRLWVLEQMSPDSAVYNVPAAFRIEGRLDVAALESAFRALLARHESLRTRFVSVEGEPRQQVLDEVDLEVALEDCPDQAAFAREAARLAARPFDLGRAPLLRVGLRRLGEEDWGLIVVLHHIVSDGWSLPILVRELAALYQAGSAGLPPALAPLPLQHKDYAAWQRALLEDASVGPHRRFWHEAFRTPPERLRLPLDFPRPEALRPEGGQVALRLDPARASALREVGRRAGASLFHALLACVDALLHRLTGQQDVTVGTVTAGRLHPDLEGQIGFYVNTLALRAQVREDETFAELLQKVRDGSTAAFDHQVYPFDRLVDELDLPRDTGHFPLFDVMVVLQNNEPEEPGLPGLTLLRVALPAEVSKFDLSFHFTEAGGGLDVVLEYRSGLFRRERIEAMGGALLDLIGAVAARPEVRIGELPLPPGAAPAETVAVTATFTAEPLEEPLAFWLDTLGIPARVAFAPYGQVFQQLLDPSSLLARNAAGANLVLVRFEDWERGGAGRGLSPAPGGTQALAGHPTHLLPNRATVAHLNAYETDDVYREIFVDRAYLRHGIVLREGDCVFDVGANIGLFSLFAKAECGRLELHAFEPAGAAFEALRRNLEAYCPGARALRCGVGGRDGEAPFTFYPRSSVFSGFHADTAADASAIRAVVRNAVEAEGLGAAEGATDALMRDRLEARTEVVPLRTLSSLMRERGVRRIDLLKIDAEKSELEILRGIEPGDWERIRQVVMEVHDTGRGAVLGEVRQRLEQAGFRLAVDQEERLRGSGLYTVYGVRPGGAEEAPAGGLEGTVRELAAALRSAALRQPRAAWLVAACPGSPVRLADPGRAALDARLAADLAAALAGAPGIVVVGPAEREAAYPVESWHDARAEELGHVPYTPAYFTALATMLARRLHAQRRAPFKAIVLDCDQTLWKGVCGEDGPEGLVVDGPWRGLQERMARLRERGLLLCLLSQNDPEDVARAFAAHPEMPLRLADFSATRIDWRPKPQGLRSLADELGLGLDSFVFVDDSPLECAAVRAGCSEVLTLQLPGDPARIPAFLDAVWAFDAAGATEEDRRRAGFYASEGDRERLRAEAPTLREFIEGLRLEVEIEPLAEADAARASQLTLRTNQFNSTTRRRTEAEIASLREAGAEGAVVRVRDRFGDYGLVGLLVHAARGEALFVDSFLLSCRALGRGVERRMLAFLGALAAKRGLGWVELDFAPSSRNRPFRDFLERLGEGEAVARGGGWVHRIAAARAAAAAEPAGADPAGARASGTAGAGGAQGAPPPAGPRTAAAPLARIAEDLSQVSAIERAVRAWRGGRRSAAGRRRAGLPAPPRNETERALARLWAEVLGLESVGVFDSFFDLGGHSLRAIRMLARAGQELGLDLTLADVFADPTIAGLVLRASRRAPVRVAPIPVAEPQPSYPLSFGQRRLWILNELRPEGSAAYNIPAAFALAGDLDVGALEEAFRRLVARHEVLRTRFVTVDGEPRQEVLADPGFRLDVDDARVLDAAGFESEARRLAREPFDFGAAPLMRVAVRRLEGGRRGLVLVIHHIVTDGWSLPILVRELMAGYGEARRGVGPERPAPRIQYKDYAVWQRSRLGDGGEPEPAIEARRAFWRERFAEPPPPLLLPADFPRPAVQGFHGADLSFRLGPDLLAGLREVGRREGASLFMTLVACVDVLLHRYSGQTDLTVGSPVAGRAHPDLEDQVGFFINTLPLRMTLAPGEPFSRMLGRLRRRTAEAFDHQDYPFDHLVEELRLPRDLGRSPLFDVMVVLENNDAVAFEAEGLAVEPVRLRHEASRYDLTLHFVETPAGLEVGVQYNTDLFRPDRIERLATHLETLVRGVVADPERPVGALPLLPEAERERVVRTFNAARAPLPAAPTLVDLFRARAARDPEAAAVRCGARRLSYRELAARAAELARRLAGLPGFAPEQPVAVLAERSEATVVALLGILEAGGAYLPLDASSPEARVAGILADSGARVLLTDRPAQATGGVRVLGLDGTDRATPERGLGAPGGTPRPPVDGQLAYVIYTSGSTGRPKGVGVEHRSFVNMILRQIEAFDMAPGDVVAQFASSGFDASLYETFLALLSGAALAIVPEEVRSDPMGFLAWRESAGASVLVLPPSLVRGLGRAPLGQTRVLVTAGEAADPGDARHYAERVRYVNAYGPTEFSVCASVHAVDPARTGASVPIGAPLANTSAYVLDGSLQPAPIGVPGELYLGGAGVARGYLGDPAQTAERFVPDPFGGAAGGRLYRTGDLARWLPEGALEFLGRADFQVKVRGHRIELGEIEAALRACPGVRDAVADLRSRGGEAEIVAYVVAAEGEPAPDALRASLAARLPASMLPARVVPLPALPLTSSGKVDRKALPEPAPERGALSVEYQDPRGELEQRIAAAWARVLGLPQVGVHDNFFDLGGNSLLLARVLAELKRDVAPDLRLLDLFAHPRIRDLAGHLQGRAPGSGAAADSVAARAARQREARALRSRRGEG